MLGYLGRIYSATPISGWTGSWTPVMMIPMPVGLVGADHIEEGLVAEGHIEVSLCLLFLLYHTWPSSVQHIQGPQVTQHDSILGRLPPDLTRPDLTP
jgi:hypothetical protein